VADGAGERLAGRREAQARRAVVDADTAGRREQLTEQDPQRRPRQPERRRGQVATLERHLRQAADLLVGRLVVTEDGQRRRHRDVVADPELADRAPASRGEQRVGRGDRHGAPRRGADAEHRLAAVLDARADGELRLATVPIEAAHRQAPGGGGAIGEPARRHDLAGRQVDHRRVPRDALAHGGTGADDVERRGLQPREQLVDVVEAGRRAGDRVAPRVRLLQAVHHRLDRLAEELGRVGDPVLGDLEHLRLGVVDRLGHVVGLAVGHLGDVAGDVDQAPQQGRVLHDAGVVGGVGDRRRGVLQGVQRLGPADLLEQPVAAQLVGDGDGVGGGARRVERPDGVEDVLVRRAVEVLRTEALLGHGPDRVTRQQQRPEDGLLRLQVVRRHAPCARGASRPVVAIAAEAASSRPVPPIHHRTLSG
jgi:hypothetical protein